MYHLQVVYSRLSDGRDVAIAACTVLEVGAWLFLLGSVTTSSLLRPVVFGTKRQFWEKKDLGKERQVLPRQLTGFKLIVSLMSARNL